ncbi:Fanconi anemia group J protein isoform 3-T3 [Spinachia spinachia]
MASSPVEYMVGGVEIRFPCKAYPSQLSMMNSIIQGLKHGKHCLLESPTGSGKSLALLCSALGWQQAELDKQQMGESFLEEKSQLDKNIKPCHCVCHSCTAASQPVVDLSVSPCKELTHLAASEQSPSTEELHPKKQSIASRLSGKMLSSLILDCEDDDDDFQPERKRFRTAEPQQRKRQRVKQGVVFIDDDEENEPSCAQSWSTEPNAAAAGLSSSCCSPELCCKCPCASTKDVAKKNENDGKKKIPKIFFGTRTHKQITQIAHELKRTAYSKVPMTILSSRAHTCVNGRVAPHANRNERCKELLDDKEGGSCSYYHGIAKIRGRSMLQQALRLSDAWDIEDFVAQGRGRRFCSYYAARELMQEASIIFCPYNYLLDPLIRESMEIDLAGQIVLLDEAHNIEDCARESSSYTLDNQSLLMCRQELDNMVKKNIKPSDHERLRGFCYSLINWIQENQSLMSERGFEGACKVWNGRDVLGMFNDIGITAGIYKLLQKSLEAVLEKENLRVIKGKEVKVDVPTISSAAATVLRSLFMVLGFMYSGNSCSVAEDYRIALQKTFTWTNQVPPDSPNALGFFVRPHDRQRNGTRIRTEVLTLSFWCLNPAVAFAYFRTAVHSVVLTSGTLSPMGSFSSELGVDFTIKLEANHVIDKSQDEVGALLLHVCQVVAKGVLCFLPSYKMLDKLRERWNNTGLWKKLEQHKAVIPEPRGGGKGDFDQLLQQYYDAIKYCEEERDGALLIAVCRGKVSEGLDFTDDNARAVITIGIPFPNIKDLQVELKMKYNDQHCKSRDLLAGHQWYEIQAYRALNQALGRCIRHKNDWGALILVDERYGKSNKYITGLSKWVRQLVQHHDTFNNAMHSLVAFSQVQQKVQGPPAAVSPPNGHQGLPDATHPQTPRSCVKQPKQDISPSSFHLFTDTQGKAKQREKADWSKMKQTTHHKNAVKPPYSIFTSSPNCLKKPIFKVKAALESRQHLERQCPSKLGDHHQTSASQRKPEVTCPTQGAGDGSEVRVEPRQLASEPSPEKNLPSCERELPSKDNPGKEEEEDGSEEDVSIYFTPELFEGEDVEEETPQKESKSAPTVFPVAESRTLPSEELCDSEQARASDGKGAQSVRKGSKELLTQQQAEEGEQVEKSRSRNQAPSTPTGAVHRALCPFEHRALLTRDGFSPESPSRRCHCAPLQPSMSDSSGPLLVVRDLASRKAMKAALQPYCDSTVTAYNAIWNPEDGSVTTLLQCKGCLSQSRFLSAAIVAAEIQYPWDMARDQVNFMNTGKPYNTHSHLAECTIQMINFYSIYGEDFHSNRYESIFSHLQYYNVAFVGENVTVFLYLPIIIGTAELFAGFSFYLNVFIPFVPSGSLHCFQDSFNNV